MRDLKFRAWDIKHKQMREVLPITLKMRDCILMQFTGLKDKNGKEIYEGDIVQFQRGPVGAHTITKTIEWGGHWNYAGFGLHGKRTEKDAEGPEYTWDALNPQWAKDIKVIGNVHENPELLKQEG